MKKILLCLFVLGIMLYGVGNIVYAQSTGSKVVPPHTTGKNIVEKVIKLQNPLKVDSIKDIILLTVDIAIFLGTAFAILAIIWVGFKFVVAQGNVTKLTEARNQFLYVIIGLAILLSSKVIVEIVRNTLVDSGVVNEKVFTNF